MSNITFNHFNNKFVLNDKFYTIKQIAREIKKGKTFNFCYESDDGAYTPKSYELNSETIKIFLQFLKTL